MNIASVCRKTGVFERCPPDATQLLQTLRVTDLVGIVSLMYSVLLHSGAPPRGDTPPPQLLGPTHAVVAAALRMLNHLAVLDLPLLQVGGATGRRGVGGRGPNISGGVTGHGWGAKWGLTP